MERIKNNFSWEQTSDKRRVRFERNDYAGQWHYNQPVWKYKHDKNRQKSDIPTNVLTNAGSKIGDEVGEITGSGKKKFHPEMIANVLSLNEMTKNTK